MWAGMGCCEHGSKPQCSIKCGECLECLKSYYILRNDCALYPGDCYGYMNISDVEKVSVNKIWNCKAFTSGV